MFYVRYRSLAFPDCSSLVSDLKFGMLILWSAIFKLGLYKNFDIPTRFHFIRLLCLNVTNYTLTKLNNESEKVE